LKKDEQSRSFKKAAFGFERRQASTLIRRVRAQDRKTLNFKLQT